MFGISAPERFLRHPNRFIRSALSIALLASLFTGISFTSAEAASNGLVFFVRQNAAVATNTLAKDEISASSANYCGSATLTTINFTSWASGISCTFQYSQSYASGFIKAPFSGLVTLTTTSDDGVQVQVNDFVGINNWNDHGATADSMSIPMVAGNYYPIKIWYANGASAGVLTLSWSWSGQSSITVPNGSLYQSIYDFDSCPLKSGIGPNCPGSSALQIKQLTNTNADGLYWIDLGDGSGAKATYSIMNSAHGGGGWMLAMKGKDSASTFAYDSAYWKDANLLNSDRPSRNNHENVDAKYLPFTKSRATDVMVIFPDYVASTYKGAYPSSGDGFAWSENLSAMRPWTASDGNSYNVNQGGDPSGTSACATYPATMQNIFSNSSRCLIRRVNSTYNASNSPYDPIGNGLFYSQTQIRFFGFNYAAASSGSQMYKARFGFGWNENGSTDESSNDGTGGLGLYTPGGLLTIASGTRNQCCATQNGVSGTNPSEASFGFELFVKNTTALTITGESSFRPNQGTSTTKTYSVTGGTSAYSYALSPVISGLSIDSSSGVLTSANSLALGTYYETVTVVDSLGASAVKPVTIQVIAATTTSDTAMTFTGSNALLSASESEFDIGTGTTFTLEAWIRPTTIAGTGASQIIAGKDQQYSIYQSESKFGFNVFGVMSGGADVGDNVSGAVPRINEWQHVELARNGSNLKFYLDGQLVYSRSDLVAGASVKAGSAKFNVGGISGQYFRGQIDQVRISSSDRSSVVATDMHTYQPSDAGLIAHYDFNEGTGNVVYNQKSGSSSATDLTLSSGLNTWPSIETSTVSGPYTTVSFPRTYLNSSGGWRTPSGITKATAIVVGGGGGGGKGNNYGSGPAGAGGGGGVNYTGALALTPLTSASIKVGMGGVGALTIADDATSRNGQSSEFNNGSSKVALGGGGGASFGNYAPAGSGVGDTTIATGGGSSGYAYSSGGCSGFNAAGGIVSSGYNAGRGVWGWGGAGGGARGAAIDGNCQNQIGTPGSGFVDSVTAVEYGRGGYSRFSTGNAVAGARGANNGWGGLVAYNDGQTSGDGYSGSSGTVIIRYITASAPTFTALASVDTTTAGKTYSFTASGSANSPLTRTFKWETSTSSGSSWSTVVGATTETYTTTTLETTTSGAQFRYRVTVTDSDTAGLSISESSTAYLVINPRIVVDASKTTFTQKYGLTDTATATASLGTGSRTFSWTTRTGITWENTTTDNAKITVGPNLNVGTYSETLTVTDSVSATTTRVFSITITKGDQPDLVIPTLGIRGTDLNLYISSGGAGDGSVTYTLPSGSGTAGCSFSGTNLRATSVGTCAVTVTKATSSNYLEKVQVVNISFIELVINIPQNNAGGGGEIGLNGRTAFETLASAPPTVSSYTNSAAVGATLSFVGTGFTSGYTVTFQASDGSEVTAAMSNVTSTSFNCVVPSNAVSGPIIVRNNIGIKRLSFTVTP